jgi:hypothetical protein
MKRRRFIQAIAASPPTARLFAQRGSGQAGGPGPAVGQVPVDGQSAPTLQTTFSEAAATPIPSFFTPDQFAALRRLSDLFLPSINGNPGALEAGAPEFLDFYTSVSGPTRQRFYKDGLDDLNTQARSKFRKPFADLSQQEADSIVKPMFIPRGPLQALLDLGPFVNRAYQDIRTVTVNSPAWAASAATAGRRMPAPLYWKKVDPTVLK